MSLKTYNKITGEWDKVGSLSADSIQVNDVEGRFESPSVRGALVEIDDKVESLSQDVEYIYQNGTIGGGGGGGGSSTPSVIIEGLTDRIVNSNEVIDIMYSFISPNLGNGIVHLTNGSEVKKLEIAQGRNKWTVGPFPMGKYVLSIMVQDKQGFWTVPAQVNITSGALELQSSFVDTRDFTLQDDINIVYNVISNIAEDVFLDYTFNGVEKTVPAHIGNNTLELGKLPFMGISSLSMVVRNSKYVSNELKYSLVAADAENLFVSTSFDRPTHTVNKNLQIDYRISMKGQYRFNTKLYIDGVLNANVKSVPGVNFWNVGDNLPIGQHTFRIVASTEDGTKSAEVSLEVLIVSLEFVPYQHVRTEILAEFEASGNLNNSKDRFIWKDTSGNGVPCNLHNFNYTTNGWVDNTLTFSGKSYAEIDLQPFLTGVKAGFTFDILYKVKNVGNVDAKVLACKNYVSPFQGFDIDTYKINLVTKNSELVSTQYQDDVWTKATYVIDRANNLMLIYINGVISAVSYLQPNNPSAEDYTDEFMYPGSIILGATKNSDGVIVENSVCSIKNIRIYGAALSHEEVLQNYIADIKDSEEQLAVRALNSDEEGLPTLNLTGNFDLMDENAERTAQVDYFDPKNPDRTISKDNCLVSWQGTSSLTYPVKNWTVKLREGGNPLLTYAP